MVILRPYSVDIIINADTDRPPAGSKPLVGYSDWLVNFLARLGYESSHAPVADLLRQSHHLEGEWLIIEPIHWQASHNDAMIVASGRDLQLTDAESRAWFTAVADFLREDKISLHYHNAQTWLINVDGLPKITSKPIHLMSNQSMMPVIKEMDNTMYWQRLMTELQMFLSAHPYNVQREGLFPVNGLWLYGEGLFRFDSKQLIITDDEHFIASFPANIKPLSFAKPIDNDAIVLINDYQKMKQDHWDAITCNRKIRWFWNNVAYSTRKKSWWSRFMRGCVNAYQTKGMP